MKLSQPNSCGEAAERKGGLERVLVPEESARFTFEMASDPEALYWEFQPDLEYERHLAGAAGEIFDDHSGEL